MPSDLRLTGVEDLLKDLADLVPDLVAETDPLERASAEDTAETLRAAYPVVTGRLRDSVEVVEAPSRSPARLFTAVVVGAPYAEYFEFGTARTGAHPTFVPISRRGREAFVKEVIARVKARGFDVTGDNA